MKKSIKSFTYFNVVFTLFMIQCNFSAAQFDLNVHYNCTTPGLFAITFDDGPHPTETEEVLNILKQYNVTATFFIQGFGAWEGNMTRYRESVSRAFNEGHQIGSHAWSHLDMTNITVEDIRKELRDLENLYVDILGVRPTIFRPPYGVYDQQLVEIANDEFNYEVIIWNIDTWDWSHPGNTSAGMEEYYNSIDKHLDDSYIALHHDVQTGAGELAENAIQFMQEQGFQLVSISDCIGISMYQ